MDSLFFYLFAFVAVTGGILLVTLRNPVSSALSMVLSFVGLAALFIGLNAYFVGIVQILVYAGAIMVLFIFIIMLLDLNNEQPVKFKSSTLIAGIGIPLFFTFQVLGVIQKGPKEHGGDFPAITEETLTMAAAKLYPEITAETPEKDKPAIYKSLTHEKAPKLPDTNLIGDTIFKHYNLPLQIMGVLLLVATVGVVVLSKRSNKNTKPNS
ncbi:MAG: NADH-quinone oxidoreductase subunit J [Akkermansiaceae bacterium]|jgi:NADH-quinone oxidoreductase subunit J